MGGFFLVLDLPPSVVCTTVNKVCASGTKTTVLAAQAIMLGVQVCFDSSEDSGLPAHRCGRTLLWPAVWRA
jgi:hypothetical protein